MKKFLILAGILALTAGGNAYATEGVQPTPSQFPQQQKMMHKGPSKADIEKFEKRLKLTDEQKAQAKAIHQKGFEEMKPIMDKIKLKREEIAAISRTKLMPEDQAARIAEVRKEIRTLKRQAHEIRVKNMREFESILTKKQLKEFEKMKAEGRKKFDKEFRKNGMLKRPPMDPELGGPKPPMD